MLDWDWLDPEFISNMVIAFVPRLAAALVILFVFWLVAAMTSKPLRRILTRADFDRALITLLVDNVYRLTILTIGIVMAISQLGIDVGAALAGLGVAGIAVGFAARDSVANTISGFLIFWDKPFGVGDFVTTQDQYGEVVDITMRTTRIRTLRNTYAVIPNKDMIQEVLVNHSMAGEPRVDVPIGIAYKESIDQSRQVVLDAIRGLKGVVHSPPPDVVVSSLGDSSVNLTVRIWVGEASHEVPTKFRVLEAAKKSLDEAGIEIPFPHLQVFVEDVEERVWNRLNTMETQ